MMREPIYKVKVQFQRQMHKSSIINCQFYCISTQHLFNGSLHSVTTDTNVQNLSFVISLLLLNIDVGLFVTGL